MTTDLDRSGPLIAWDEVCLDRAQPDSYGVLCVACCNVGTPREIEWITVVEARRRDAKVRADATGEGSGRRKRGKLVHSISGVAAAFRKRVSYIQAQIDAGNVKAISVGLRMDISDAEFQRLQREGMPPLPGESDPAAHAAHLPRREKKAGQESAGPRPKRRRAPRSKKTAPATTPAELKAQIKRIPL